MCPETDCTAVRKLGAAGMVLLGKTHTVQLGGGITGINQDLGTPHNPWMEEPHVPGGSSSGSAVAVAGRLAPIALGGDTGGSVRVPASLCGVVGLKTTVGRISRAGVHPMAPTLDSVGLFGRSVADVAVVYQHLQGPDERDETTLGRPEQDVLSGLASGVDGLRIATPENVLFDDCDPEVEAAVRRAADLLGGMGAQVSHRVMSELDVVQNMPNRYLLTAVETYANHKHLLETRADELDPIITWAKAGRDVPAVEYCEVLKLHAALRRDIVATMEDLDGLLCPTTLLPALPLNTIAPNLGRYVETYQDDPSERYARNASMGNFPRPLRYFHALRLYVRRPAHRPADLCEALSRRRGANDSRRVRTSATPATRTDTAWLARRPDVGRALPLDVQIALRSSRARSCRIDPRP